MSVDTSIARLSERFEREVAITQNLTCAQALRESGSVTIHQTQNVGVSAEIFAVVLRLAKQMLEDDELRGHLYDIERRAILAALERNDWSQAGAAEQLGVSRRVLGYKIEQHGITHVGWRTNVPEVANNLLTG